MPVLFSTPPCPITINPPLTQGVTNIHWDSDNVNGLLTQQELGGTETQIDPPSGPPVRRNNVVSAQITVGKQYVFRLKNPQGIVLLTLQCAGVRGGTGVSPAAGLEISDISSELGRGGFFQTILGLDVFPGAGSVTFRFNTSQESVPIIEIANAPPHQDAAGVMRVETWERVKTSWPVLQGMKTQHHARVMDLEQDTDYWYIITADGRDRGDFSQRWGSFRTSSRSIRVLFDRIDIHFDGDPNSPGEMYFQLGVYAGGGTPLLAEAPGWGRRKAFAGGTIGLGQTVVADQVPQTIAIFAYGDDDDTTDLVLVDLDEVQFSLPNVAPASGWGEGATEWCRVLQDVELPDEVVDQPWEQAFHIRTPNGGIQFTVHGMITVLPTTFSSQGVSPKRSAPKHAVIDTRSGAKAIAGGRSAHVLAMSARGEVFHRALMPDANGARRDDWTSIGQAVSAPITSLASPDDGMDLFSIGAEGSVIHKWLEREKWNPSLGDWVSLGGAFVGPIYAAAIQGTSRVHLVAIDADGNASYKEIKRRSLASDGHAWHNIGGGGFSGEIRLVSSEQQLELFAIGRNGEVLYKALRGHDWSPAKKEWRRIAGPYAGPLTTQRIRDGRLVVLARNADRRLYALEWDSVAQQAVGEWTELGTLDELASTAR